MLGAEQHPAQVDVHDAVVLGHGDLVHRLGAADAGDVEHRVDATERLQRGREHRLDLFLLRDVDAERHHRVAEPARGLLLTSADVGGEHLRALADEHAATTIVPSPIPRR